MNEEGFEEWDADFLDQLIQVEELALSSSSKQEPVATNTISISYSPPRHLSQRTDPFTLFSNGIAKSDLEIDRLKVGLSFLFFLLELFISFDSNYN
jgi:hypothetical protein